MIYLGTHGLLQNLEINQIKEFEVNFLNAMSTQHKDVMDELAQGILSDKAIKTIEKVASDLIPKKEKK